MASVGVRQLRLARAIVKTMENQPYILQPYILRHTMTIRLQITSYHSSYVSRKAVVKRKIPPFPRSHPGFYVFGTSVFHILAIFEPMPRLRRPFSTLLEQRTCRICFADRRRVLWKPLPNKQQHAEGPHSSEVVVPVRQGWVNIFRSDSEPKHSLHPLYLHRWQHQTKIYELYEIMTTSRAYVLHIARKQA